MMENSAQILGRPAHGALVAQLRTPAWLARAADASEGSMSAALFVFLLLKLQAVSLMSRTPRRENPQESGRDQRFSKYYTRE